MTPIGCAAIRPCAGWSAAKRPWIGLPRPARWAASRPNGWRGRKPSPLLPICRANGSTRCTSGVSRGSSCSIWIRAKARLTAHRKAAPTMGIRLHLLSSAVCVQPAWRSGAVLPALGQRAQRRQLARSAGAGGRPLPCTVKRCCFRGDAAFANPEIYEFLEAEGMGYAIRLPANRVLQDKIGYLLKRPVGRPPQEVRRCYASFRYQAGSWTKPRRVVAKVEWHPGELYPRVGFIVTNLARPVERLVAFYNHRGTCEQYIKEGKGAAKWPRLSCRSFAANAVRLQLHALAYNLGNFMRTLAMPKTAEPWSLTSMREKLIKIGAKVVSHGRYVTFQM